MEPVYTDHNSDPELELFKATTLPFEFAVYTTPTLSTTHPVNEPIEVEYCQRRPTVDPEGPDLGDNPECFES